MKAAPRYFSFVMIDIDPDVEDEFNQWYNDVHLRPVIACSGYISGLRLVVADPNVPHRYAALYEADSIEAFDSEDIRKVKGWGPFADKLRYVQPRVIFRTTGPFLHKDEDGKVREAIGQTPVFSS